MALCSCFCQVHAENVKLKSFTFSAWVRVHCSLKSLETFADVYMNHLLFWLVHYAGYLSSAGFHMIATIATKKFEPSLRL